MSCNCGCSCGYCGGIDCYSKPCYSCGCISTTTTTTTTTINPNCEQCETFYDCECVIYNGPNIECYDLNTGDNLCEILETIIQNLPECKTTLPPFDCTFTGKFIDVTPTTTCAPEEFVMQAFGVSRIILGIIISNGPFRIDWGDGTINSYTDGFWSNFDLDHTYSSLYTGPVKIISCNLSDITEFYDSNQSCGGFCGGHMTIQTTELGKLDQATHIEILSQTVQGDVINLPRTLTNLVIWGGDHAASAFNNQFNGDGSINPYYNPNWCSTAYTNPTGQNSQGNTMYGNVVDLPRLLIGTGILGENTITGLVSDIPRLGDLSGHYSFALGGNNTLSGNIADLPVTTNPANDDYIEIGGWNTVTGDIANIPDTYGQVWIDGKKGSSTSPNPINPGAGNTLYGDVVNLPAHIVYFHIWGMNTISGNIESINNVHSTIKYINIAGRNTIAGTLDAVQCENIEIIDIYGYNTISGDITGLNSDPKFNHLKGLEIAGQNSITGALSGIPIGIYVFAIESSNGASTLTGSISDLSGLTNLLAFGAVSAGNNITGDIADFPSKVSEVYIYTNSGGINTYTPGHTWPNPMGYFYIHTPLIFSQTTINNLVNDLNTPPSPWVVNHVAGHPEIYVQKSPQPSNAGIVTSLTVKVGGSSYIQFIP